MQNIREKIKRKLSMHDKNRKDLLIVLYCATDLTSIANLDEVEDENDVDDETTGNLGRDIEKAESDGHDQGKPGSFLNKLIMHGNKKTEEQIAREQALSSQNK